MRKLDNPDPQYPPPEHFVAWLDEEKGRAAYFQKVDPCLFTTIISRMKTGQLPITFSYAIRIERAQKASDNPLKAEELMTFLEDRALYRYVKGIDPAPAPVVVVRRNARRPRELAPS